MPKYRYTAVGVVHARLRNALMLHLILSMRADRWGVRQEEWSTCGYSSTI
ncbi:hypothetical protein [Xylella fastidiosa]|nr:hypothetical protein [Xylella fastidiosa]WNY18720.1 hypothetical protein RO839_09645 [Xylella fastidiosa]WNY21008.1 hypothetical protein RO838_09660 [Xylella fastidiosa]